MAVLGATITVVIVNRAPAAPPPAASTQPVSSEVTLESSLWKTKKVQAKAQKENTPLELGTRFRANKDGEVAGIRFYKPAGEAGSHRGSLWDSRGKLLAKVTFTGESDSGWQQALFDEPVRTVAGRTYTVSYHTTSGGYVAKPGAFKQPVTSGPLTAEAGVFGITGKAGFPSRVHPRRVSYYVDLIFRHRERRWHHPRPSGRPGGPTTEPTTDPTVVPTPTSTGRGGETVPDPTRTPTETPTAPEATPTLSHAPTPTRVRTPTATPTFTRNPTPKPSQTATKDPTPTPAPPTRTTTPPPTRGFPGPGDTGVPSGITLKESKSITVTKDGTVIDAMEVRGEINVDASNVVIKNTRVAAAPGQWGIIQRKGRSGLVVENSEIFGNGRDQTQFGIINQGGDLTVRRADIHTISNGILTEQGLIEDNYLHDPKYFSGDHTDMIMCTSGPPSGAKLVIRGNTVINTLDQTGAIALFQDFGVVKNVTVEGNFLAGGGYSLYAGAGSKGVSSNIKVIGNVFSKDVWAKGGYHGPVAYWDKNGSGNEWRDNVWEDGKTVSP